MSRDYLGSKQTIVLHKCLYKNDRYDLVITPHRETIGFIKSKRQARKNTIITKQMQIIRKRFSKQRNPVSESETNTIQELQDLKDSINKNNPIEDHIFFLTQKLHHHRQLNKNAKKSHK